MKIGQYLVKLQVVKKLLPKHTDTHTHIGPITLPAFSTWLVYFSIFSLIVLEKVKS